MPTPPIRSSRCGLVADVAVLAEGDVVFLPAAHQVLEGRRIAGATVRVKNLATAHRVIDESKLTVAESGVRGSIFLPPEVTHGLWLELREGR